VREGRGRRRGGEEREKKGGEGNAEKRGGEMYEFRVCGRCRTWRMFCSRLNDRGGRSQSIEGRDGCEVRGGSGTDALYTLQERGQVLYLESLGGGGLRDGHTGRRKLRKDNARGNSRAAASRFNSSFLSPVFFGTESLGGSERTIPTRVWKGNLEKEKIMQRISEGALENGGRRDWSRMRKNVMAIMGAGGGEGGKRGWKVGRRGGGDGAWGGGCRGCLWWGRGWVLWG